MPRGRQIRLRIPRDWPLLLRKPDELPIRSTFRLGGIEEVLALEAATVLSGMIRYLAAI